MRRICTTAAATALLVLLLSAASVAHAGTLSVRSVSAPRSATAGLPVWTSALQARSRNHADHVEKPSYADLSVQALVHTRDGTWKTEDWYQRQPGVVPARCKGPPGRADPRDLEHLLDPGFAGTVPLRLLATNIGCSRYSGEASGTSTYTSGTDSTEESWKAIGLVYDRILADDIKAPRFIFNLTAGSVSWSMTGHSNGCAVKAGPATLPVRADGYNGQLDIRSTSGAPGTWDRRYFAQAFGFPAVQGTATCPSGTYTRWFAPRTSILSTSAGVLNLRAVPPDGILAGTETRTDTAGLTATCNWRLVPER